MTERILNIISLGAGVQSSTMCLMAAHGEIVPMPDCAIFADTQREPKEVYEWLGYLTKQLPFPVIQVTKGNLAEKALQIHTSKKSGKLYTNNNIPVFIKNPDGSQGLQGRQCTQNFKIQPVKSKIWELRKRAGKPYPHVKQWIGISRDEAHRMKPSRVKYMTNIFPLVDMGITRTKCLEWMAEKGYPTPPRSACDLCPYHGNPEWNRLKTEDPKAFDAAVKFEKDYQNALAQIPNIHGTPWLHRQMIPLDEVDFTSKEEQHPDLFGNECEGMCGV